MHIEIVINKEKQIAQPVLEALSQRPIKIYSPCTLKLRSESVRVARMG